METKDTTFQGRIGVIGAGALGCFYGARLARAGCDVHFLMRRDYGVVKEKGLKIVSFEGDFEIRPPVFPSAEAMGRCDLLIVGLKTTDNDALRELLAPTAGPETLVLTMQNGLGNEETIAAALEANGQPGMANAAERILGAPAFLCSHRGEPGVAHHTDHGWIQLAEHRGGATDRTRGIAALFTAAAIRCEVLDSLVEARWRKLVWNVPFNGLGVAAGHADTDSVLGDATLEATARGLMEETIAAARADGVTIEKAYVGRMMEHTSTMGAYKSSMQIDYENGRPLEVEPILGEPVRRAKAAGIAVPRMEMLYGIVRRADRLNRG
jgi:2-dehydropantoate 2-reductase